MAGSSIPFSSTRRNWLVLLVAGLGLVSFLINAYQLVSIFTEKPAAALVVTLNDGEQDKDSISQYIDKYSLFHDTTPHSEPVPEDGVDTPVLRGTFSGKNPDNSYAIIAEPGFPEKSYRAGDHLAGGAKLTGVFADHAVIEQSDGEHTLFLKKK